MNTIKAAIFDLDGLLIDSEPLWEEAETNVFTRHGIEVTKEICQKVKGFRVDESIHYIYHLKPFPNPDFKRIEENIVSEVRRLIETKGKGMPGCVYILHFFRSRGIRMALASSSRMDVIQTALDRLGIKHHFDFVHSAGSEPYGKPHPGIFLTTAATLAVSPSECIVFEDSVNGIIAAKAARMRAVAIPDPTVSQHPVFAIADLQLASLLQFKEQQLNQLEHI